MTNNQNHSAIIGAGIGGLSAAYDLVQAGHKVTIFEAADHVGGLAAGFKELHWDWTVERFYHHWFATDEHILGLIDELGWSDQVLFPRPVTVMYYQGKFYPFDSITAALMYPGLCWGINKIRFGLVGLYLRLTNNWQSLEKTTVDKWMRKWAGDKVYESMWEPMMIGKFGEEYAKVVNMAWLWARLHARTTRLGTFEGGFQVFANKFADRLRQMSTKTRYRSPPERGTNKSSIRCLLPPPRDCWRTSHPDCRMSICKDCYRSKAWVLWSWSFPLNTNSRPKDITGITFPNPPDSLSYPW